VDRKFPVFWKHYLIQSAMAALTVFFVLIFLSLEHSVIIASLGATAFIVFAMPGYPTAKPRNVIGGHLIGLFWGTAFSFLHFSRFFDHLAFALAVGFSILTMVVTDTEHPPAAGTALGVSMTGITWPSALAVILGIAAFSLIHRFCRRFLKDLT